MTNGDKIRAMNDKELAKFISDIIGCCDKGWQWCEKCPLHEAGRFCDEDEFVRYFGKEVSEYSTN